jgi:hypothetical protein
MMQQERNDEAILYEAVQLGRRVDAGGAAVTAGGVDPGGALLQSLQSHPLASLAYVLRAAALKATGGSEEAPPTGLLWPTQFT